MDVRRLRAGEWATGASGVVLAVALFLPWYWSPVGSPTGFEALGVVDIVLAAAAVLAIAVMPITAGSTSPSVPLAYQALVWLVAAVGAVLAVIRLIAPPIDGASLRIGAWLGAGAAVALLATLLAAMRDERLSRGGRLTDSTGVPIAAPPEIETLPAPRA